MTLPSRLPNVARTALQKLVRNPLFHGTRYADQILRRGALVPAEVGDPVISFTRNPAIAFHFACLPRGSCSATPTILVFERDRLRANYRLEPVAAGWNDHPEGDRYEAEERCYEPISIFRIRPLILRENILADLMSDSRGIGFGRPDLALSPF